jgi:putative CocE/NonD family hydrolase
VYSELRFRSWVLTAGILMYCSGASAQPGDLPFLIETDVRVPTRAGFTVSANVYRPNREGRFPVLISMGPYGKDDLPAEYDGLFENGQIAVSEYAAFETPDPEYWAHYDYVVIAADSPGSGLSGGDMDLFGPIENEAFYDLIEWAGVQPWSNGNVGLGGVSYFGVTQWYVAALRPPHLKAIMPGEALTDLYRDAALHGGILSDFTPSWTQYRILPAKRPDADMVRNIATGIQEHPLYDEYWRSWQPDLASITVPAYVIASWPDHGLHTRGTLIGFEAIGSEEKWLDVHGRKKWEYYYSRESLERQRRFFDHFLKGADNGMSEVPAVRYERRNAFYDGAVRFADSWPRRGTEYEAYYLTADGRMMAEPSSDSTALTYDSLDAQQQLSFRHTFDTATEITGTATLKLWVETDGADDMDIYVGLSKLDRGGNEVSLPGYNDVEHGHVASGWLRVSHRELDADLSTVARPVLRHERLLKLGPGERVPVEIEILPSSTLFRAGETLVVRVQGTELRGAGDITHLNGVNAGEHIIHVGGASDSQLVIPVIPD